jgi:hypothetical protein
MRTKVVLPDASPLFSFEALGVGGLDLILRAGMPVVLTDYIEWEATRSGSDSAKAIAAWIAAHPDQITVVETERGQDRIAKEKAGITSKKLRRNVGEQTIFEAISEGDVGPGPMLFLYEEDKFVDPSFYGRHPVHSVTTYGFLVGLERSGIIDSADKALALIRSNGRDGVKALLIDRPYNFARPGPETTWRP